MFPTGTPSATQTIYYGVAAGLEAHESCTFYWESPVMGDVTDVQAACDALWDASKVLLAAMMPDQMKIFGQRYIYRSGTDFIEVWNGSGAGGAQAGTAATVLLEGPQTRILPQQDCLVIRRLTGKQGRKHQGRVFISGVWEDFNDGGFLNSDAQVPARAIASFFGADFVLPVGASLHARHWNRVDNVLEVVTRCTAMTELKSRRDRQPFGQNYPL